MRTGIIHLTGLAATLLFALTIIAWVSTFDDGTVWGYTSGTLSIETCVTNKHIAVFEYHGLLTEFDEPRIGTRTLTNVDVLDLYIGKSIIVLDVRYGFGVETANPPGLRVHSHVLVPLWLAVLMLGIPSIIYLRFLRRRKRHPSAGGDDSDASDTSDDDAGSVDESVSHTS